MLSLALGGIGVRHILLQTVCALALASGGAARADEVVATVDPLTVIATRSEKLLSEVPATVSVITADDIDENLVTDIKDLVRHEAGVSVRSSPARFGAALGTTGRDGNSGFNIRGLEGNRVLIQTDGIRTPDSFVFGAQAVGRGDYGDLDLLKSVEILRGPASALYGSDGVAGAVSFTTKDPSDLLAADAAWSLRAKGAYASADESWAGGLVGAISQGRWSSLIAYSHRDGHEQESQGANAAANTDRTAANPQDSVSNSVLGKLVFDHDEANRFRLTYEHVDQDVATNVLSAIAKPPLGASSVLSLTAKDEIRRDRISLDHHYDGDGRLFQQASWNLYYQDSTTSQFSAEDRNVSVDRTRRNTFDNRVIGGSLELDSKLELGGLTHRLTYGGDVSKTRQEGVRTGTVPPAGETYPTRAFPNTDYVLAGVFVQDELKLFDDRLSLYPALRYDWYSLDPEADPTLPAFTPADQGDARLSPKIGAMLKLNGAVGLFLNYAEGFKAPAPSQVNNAFVNLIQNYRSIPNPDLKPETSETLEGGVRLHGTVAGARWGGSVTAFSGRYEDFIEQVQIGGSFTPTDPGVFQVINLGKVKIEGWEAKAEGRWDNGISVSLAAAYARGQSTVAGAKAPLDSVDPTKVIVGLSYRDPQGRFGGQVFATHSEAKKSGRVAQACTPSCFLPSDFTILDLTAYWNLTDQLRINAGVFNLTDETYFWWNDVRGLSSTAVSRDAYSQPGRNVAVAVTVNF